MGPRRIIGRILKRVLPAPTFARLKSTRARKYGLKVLRDNGFLEISQRVVEQLGTTVLRGPFSGLRFPAEVLLSLPCTHRIVGSYEKELQPIFQNLVPEDYEMVVDIGSAEGYYAIGLARLLRVPVVAFDVDPEERRRCRQTAEMNGVGSLVQIEAYCSGPTLRRLAYGKRCLIVSDCEGYEAELFDQATAAGLPTSDVLIEIHESGEGCVYEAICRVFSASHSIDTYEAMPRDAADYPELAFLGAEASKAIEEWRDAQQRWVFLRSRIDGRQSNTSKPQADSRDSLQ